MTFDPSKPRNNKSPADFPQENRNNMARLQRMLEEDHQFNDVAAQNDGWHKIVHWVQESGTLDPTNPGATSPPSIGGPPMSWEQEDTSNVARVWFKEANNGLVHSMIGYTAITVDALEMQPAVITPIVKPPNDSYGHILYRVDANTVGAGFYWKIGGRVTAYSCEIASYDNLSNYRIRFGRSQPPGELDATYIGGRLTSMPNPLFANFRILYRYI